MKLYLQIIFILFFVQIIFPQTNAEKLKPYNCHTCKPIFLPQPEYSEAAKFVGVSGNVVVQVFIDEKGNVESAKAISGHLLLQTEAVKAAYLAKFNPPPLLGKRFIAYTTVEYNFVSDEFEQDNAVQNIVNFGILNEKALILPMPRLPSVQPRGDGKIEVEVKINLQNGEVVSAEASEGHPLIRAAAEQAALQAEFPPILTEFPNVFGQGFLIYEFEDFNGKTIENKTPKKFLIIEKGVVNDRAKSLPKPFYHPDIKATGIVEVKIFVDTNGKVPFAKAVSGHPLLRPFAESAARETTFAPTVITTEPLYVKASLLYKFNSDHTVETNLTDKDLK